MEMAHLSHWEYDVANDLFTFNDQFYKIFHTTAKQVGGYTMSSSEYARRFVHPDDIPVVGEETRKAVESTDPHYSRRLEHRMLYADGTIGHIAVLFFIVKDANGRTVRTYGVNQDITARKRAEEEVRKINAELEQRIADRTRDLGDSQLALLNVVDDLNRHSKNLDGANEKLAAANKELEAFSYSVSHDLRAPLRHLGGFVELLKEKLPPSTDEETGHYLKVISDSAAQMSRLVDDLLSFSRMGRAEMSKARVRFDKLVDEAIDTLQPATRGREIAWKIAPLPEVTGDASMLRLVMVNLIANAVKFTGSRPKAEIEIRCDQSNEDEYIFSVGDNGAGFDMKYTDKLFHLFQRLHRADEFEGTGAGLANVRRIVQRHGGRTWAEGAVGNGAVFYFSLPRGTPVER
jgi:signal transduction histidine kinase